MNCKPGDLAVTVMAPQDVAHKNSHNNIGRIVEVVRFVGDHTFPRQSKPTPNVWECRSRSLFLDSLGNEWSGELLIGDKNLRPIRDQDGDDEVLLIAQRKDDRKVPA
jgi:hypothetical protein